MQPRRAGTGTQAGLALSQVPALALVPASGRQTWVTAPGALGRFDGRAGAPPTAEK